VSFDKEIRSYQTNQTTGDIVLSASSFGRQKSLWYLFASRSGEAHSYGRLPQPCGHETQRTISHSLISWANHERKAVSDIGTV
jgi:hypothetical protein